MIRQVEMSALQSTSSINEWFPKKRQIIHFLWISWGRVLESGYAGRGGLRGWLKKILIVNISKSKNVNMPRGGGVG